MELAVVKFPEIQAPVSRNEVITKITETLKTVLFLFESLTFLSFEQLFIYSYFIFIHFQIFLRSAPF